MPHTAVQTTGFKSVQGNNAAQMKAALAISPLSVIVDGASTTMQSYRSGIVDDTACGTEENHATNVVGWGVSGDTEYWIMRNSWGTHWGEKGYMRLQITDGPGICGIQQLPQYPTV